MPIPVLQAHFEDDQFKLTRKGKKRLRQDAIPTLFTHLATVKRRKPPMVRINPAPVAVDVDSVLREHNYTAKAGTGILEFGNSISSYISYSHESCVSSNHCGMYSLHPFQSLNMKGLREGIVRTGRT